jgi:hypothetical protein
VTVTYDFTDDLAAGSPTHFIQASRVDQNISDLISAIQQTLALTGETTPTANIGWGAYNLTNVGRFSVGDGTSAAPAIYNEGDSNTGMLFPAADQVQLNAGGIKILLGTASALTLALATTFSAAATFSSTASFSSVLVGSAGTSAAPAFTTTGDLNTGIWFPAADTVQLNAGGTRVLSSTASALTVPLATTFSLPLIGPVGTSAAPAFTFAGDSDTGIFRPSANELRFVTNGATRFKIDSSGNATYGVVGAGQSFLFVGAQAKATVASISPLIIQTNDAANAETLSFAYTGSAASATRIWDLEATDQGVGYTPLRLQPNGGDLLRSLSPVALSTNTIGYLGCPINTQDNNYTLLLTDAGKTIYHTSGSTHTYTIPANASVVLPIGSIIRVDNENGGGNVTVAITSDTLRWASSTGSRTLAANGTAVIQKMTATLWRMTGSGIT